MFPCVSLYMLELHSYKHTNFRKVCSLRVSFGLGITARENSSTEPLRGISA